MSATYATSHVGHVEAPAAVVQLSDSNVCGPAVPATCATSHVGLVDATAAVVQHGDSNACGNRPWVSDCQFLPSDSVPAILGSSKIGSVNAPQDDRIKTSRNLFYRGGALSREHAVNGHDFVATSAARGASKSHHKGMSRNGDVPGDLESAANTHLRDDIRLLPSPYGGSEVIDFLPSPHGNSDGRMST